MGCRFSSAAILLNSVAGSTGKNKYSLCSSSQPVGRPAGQLCLSAYLQPGAKDFCFHFFHLIFFNQCPWCWVGYLLKAKGYMIRTHLKVRPAVDKLIWFRSKTVARLQMTLSRQKSVCVKSFFLFFFVSLVLSDALRGEQQVCFSCPANWHPWRVRRLWSKNTLLWVLEWMSWK